MHRYTTPTLTFKLPMDTSELSEVFVTVKQGGEIIEKTLTECETDGAYLKAKLTQAETGELDDHGHCEIQVRAKDYSGNAYASRIFKVPVEKILKEGVI